MNTKHLKAKILDLAIRGKLVEQKAEDGNAFDLLQKIREEKMSHGLDFANAKSRKNKQQPETALAKVEDAFASDLQCDNKNVSDVPFEIPENWCWCKLKEISIISTGSTPLKSNKKYYDNGTIPFITSADTSKAFVDKAQFFITQLALEENHLEMNPIGSLIVAMYGEGKTRGQITELSIPATTNQACAVIKLTDENKILRAFVKNFFFYNYENIRRQAKGGNQANLNLTNIGNIYFPLPPLPEQKRIVSAIEKAFEQIDIIEKNKLNLKTYIKQTKSKVLDLAIHGKLVEQNPQEGNAADLLQKIREEKMSHGLDFANAKSKKNKQQTETALAVSNLCDNKNENAFESEIPFEIPENWCWCRLGELISIKSGDFLKVGDNQNGVIPIYGGNGVNGYCNKYNVEEKTIIIGRVGFYCGSVHITNGKSWITDNAFITSFNRNILNIDYLSFMLKKLDLRSKSNSTAQPVVSGRSIYPILFPLPPLSEQKRIVAKIEQVFEQLDVLEKSLGE